jgi:hypothetical protein
MRALISVSDKTGLIPWPRDWPPGVGTGFDGGTAKALSAAGLRSLASRT